MIGGYFNYFSHIAEGYWERRSFLGAWRRLYGRDRRWTPPFHPLLARALSPGKCEHVSRMQPTLVYLEALPGRPRTENGQNQFTVAMEEPVAAAVILADARRRDRHAYLALLHCANDEESLERLIALASEQAWASGCSGLIGPVGLSPHLGSGVLLDHFHLGPPLHTAYNPPYLPELIDGLLEKRDETQLYCVSYAVHAPVDASDRDADDGVVLCPLEPGRLAGDLLPLLQAACEPMEEFPPPDAAEAAFMLEWLGIFPLSGWVAYAGDEPVGFVLMQADLGAALRLARGGRNPLWRGWLAWRGRRAARAGRLLFGAVLPEHRRRGIGRTLWRAAMTTARDAGWREMSIGPVAAASAGAAFLAAMGAQPRQRYRLYATDEG